MTTTMNKIRVALAIAALTLTTATASLAQAPRSICLQRSLQKGRKALLAA